MDFDEIVDSEETDLESIDVEALFRKARRSRQINEADVEAILASADEDQAEELYQRLQRLGISIVTESGETIDDGSESSNVLGLDDDDDDDEDDYYDSG